MLLLNEKDRTKKFLLHQLPITCTDNVGYVQIKLYIPVNGMLKLLQVPVNNMQMQVSKVPVCHYHRYTNIHFNF